ncbi:MAG: DNA polymerase III subunit gamma/tau [Desulfovibrio sp.]|nr:MAG: DNA polymerase III subunit gamma/tau [Desulfovibrio sp.]
MSQASLTAKYRPQRFKDVAGQETVRTVLSLAAAEDKIAPAYLFSGTRGVGKTTIARILAKAINCAQAPTAEPCNECANCRQITQSSGVDVIEIDGASNRGIDDARRLREDIGFAPMEFRYKVFIIDEAHMLTREAFNALLKTLEEPPGHVTFILATTEPHKFPATIISRCQHYIFQRLTEPELTEHLKKVLGRENAEFEESAVNLIAKRAAGSVRDSMSLLGQVMALGQGSVREADVRSILGLAGREVYEELFAAIAEHDVVAVSGLLRKILDQGLDLGFFLRELSQMWRNLFLLSQAGDKGLEILEMPREEASLWLDWSAKFPVTQIHASWQMTLEAQRKVLTSLEPALALELLLLNLTYMDKLLSLEDLSQQGRGPAGGRQGSGPGLTGGGRVPQTGGPARSAAPAPSQVSSAEAKAQDAPYVAPPAYSDGNTQALAGHPQPRRVEVATPPPAMAPQGQGTVEQETVPVPDGPKTWDGYVGYCAQLAKQDGKGVQHLRHAQGQVDGKLVRIICRNQGMCDMVSDKEYIFWLNGAAKHYFGPDFEVRAEVQEKNGPSVEEQRQSVENHPVVKQLKDEFKATVVRGTMRPLSDT